ncbi:hypothetical protein SLEP1_g54383 [Rubroshorea leprosula]|uniref:mitogen-activated protein kinase n=1 Tax=Rubroshorea leprosula TaxID=152421 RepID=A0AAV5MC74_9ROSI|nr:hypothetical protein SLEP1_g54383 [Rubroshorea leprosula]
MNRTSHLNNQARMEGGGAGAQPAGTEMAEAAHQPDPQHQQQHPAPQMVAGGMESIPATLSLGGSSALNFETNEHVAIKKIANAFDNKIDAKRTLREIKLLRHLDHENEVAIRDIIPPPQRGALYELMATDLHQIIRSNRALSEEHCQYFKCVFPLIGTIVRIMKLDL